MGGRLVISGVEEEAKNRPGASVASREASWGRRVGSEDDDDYVYSGKDEGGLPAAEEMASVTKGKMRSRDPLERGSEIALRLPGHELLRFRHQ